MRLISGEPVLSVPTEVLCDENTTPMAGASVEGSIPSGCDFSVIFLLRVTIHLI